MRGLDQVRVALLQLHPAETAQDNPKKELDACRKTREMVADIDLFPEILSCGYNIYDRSAQEWTKDVCFPTEKHPHSCA